MGNKLNKNGDTHPAKPCICEVHLPTLYVSVLHEKQNIVGILDEI